MISAKQCLMRSDVIKYIKCTNHVPGHGPQTGRCVPSDRARPSLVTTEPPGHVCEIQSWCPVEDDR